MSLPLKVALQLSVVLAVVLACGLLVDQLGFGADQDRTAAAVEERLQDLSSANVDSIRTQVEENARGLSEMAETAVDRAMMLGGLEAYDAFEVAFTSFPGVHEIGLVDRNAKVIRSSSGDPADAKMDTAVWKRLAAGEPNVRIESDDELLIYHGHEITKRCAICHRDWERGALGAVSYVRFSREALLAMEAANATALGRAVDEQRALCEESVRTGHGRAVVILLASLGIAGIVLVLLLRRGLTRPIRRVVTDLRTGADEVSAASGQIAGTAQAQARQSGDSAASLEESAAVTHQLAEGGRENAERGTGAAEHAVRARSSVETSTQSVERIRVAMNGIAESGREVSGIIRIIEDIAFQTNLLALNAAVEAARAGEHGKGFAVVAEEVRSLAGRSAEAARKTADLIHQNENRVDEGGKLLDELVEAMRGIRTEMDELDGLIDGIASSATEQASGVEQLNSTIESLSHATSESAAHAETTAAASEELSGQSERLRDAVRVLERLVTGNRERPDAPVRRPAPVPPPIETPAPREDEIPEAFRDDDDWSSSVLQAIADGRDA